MLHPVTAPTGRPLVSAVTGTNGKTSVTSATLQLMRAIGWPAAGYDSTAVTDVHGVRHKARVRRSTSYVREMIDFQAKAGATAFALEAFVGLLADGMFTTVEVDTAVCTGLELDHLDVHGSPEAYWRTKLKLFDTYLRPDGVAVMAVDCALGERVEAAVARRGARLVRVGDGGDVSLVDTRPDGEGLTGSVRIHDYAYEVAFPFSHDIAVTNALLAAVAVISAGGPPQDVLAALAHVTPPAGRLQRVADVDGVTVMVDTAHNPGALRTALTAARARTDRRLIVVFGAGGERDRGKRPAMGRIAARLADLVVLTDDNPRRESPDVIRRAVREGCPDCLEIPRRADAIEAAVRMARPGDLVLVAGKGDETEQVVGRGRRAYDDREVIRRLAAQMTS